MDQDQLNSIWQQILSKVQETLSADACQKWLSPLKLTAIGNDIITLTAPNSFYNEWIKERYLGILEDAVGDVLSKRHQISLEVEDTSESPATNNNTVVVNKGGAPVQGTLPNLGKPAINQDDSLAQISPGDASSLNPSYTFETFVTGSSNRFAHAAALAIAKNPGKTYNPFFIYGGVGLGKTHLMHAIGNEILKNNPSMRVLYVSSEHFTNELINMIRDGKAELFRQKYRNIDVLMVDDIQFISGKTSTQEEFFHTFNTLHDAEKHIILSSDRPPSEVKELEDRLRSRFEWGLITDIQPPDLETRIAILRKKAMLEKLDVPNDVMIYIASHIAKNIRKLEGALTRVVAYASLTNKQINSDTASEALRDIVSDNVAKVITVDLIKDMVSSYFSISLNDLNGRKRTADLAYARQVAMYLCREMTETSLPQIGKSFGRDHTTVLHACEKIGSERNSNAKIKKNINDLIEAIRRT